MRRRSPASRSTDALERVAATGALERSRAIALDYAAAGPRRPRRRAATASALEALTHAVVDRER